jgi:hypothetical protein
MPKRVQLQMTSSNYSIITRDTEEIDTNDMGDCVTVVIFATGGIRAQHCLGGIEAAVAGICDLAVGDRSARAVFVGGSITDYVRGKCGELLSDAGVNAPYAVIHRSRAIINVNALALAGDASQIAASVQAYAEGMPSKKGCCVIM